MFTGIIEDIGKVVTIKNNLLVVSTILDDIRPKDSIAVNGVCLTVNQIKKSGLNYHLFFDLGEPTRRRTNLSTLKVNSPLNLERSLMVGGRLSGHFVLGHVEGVGKILEIKKVAEEEIFLKISVPENIRQYLVARGSIAVDGISLTIAELGDLFFVVDIIPETLRRTNLQFRRRNDLVNIEPDILARYARSPQRKEEITLEKLQEEGYI